MDEEMLQMLMDLAYANWDPNSQYGHMNQLPEQLYDQYKPRSDSAANTMAQRMVGGPEAWGDFSNDVLLQADPLVQPFLAEALANNKDLAGALNYINDGGTQDDWRQRIGRTYWDDLAASGPADVRGALRRAGTGQERDAVAMDYLQQSLGNLLAQGSPSVARNAGLQQWAVQSAGGRAYPQQELPEYGGPGFGGEMLGGGGDGGQAVRADDFARGGGYVGPGSPVQAERRDYLAELSKGQLASLTGTDRPSAQLQSLQDFKPRRTQPGPQRQLFQTLLERFRSQAQGRTRSGGNRPKPKNDRPWWAGGIISW